MNGSALQYFRYFSKYSHWICIFDISNWNLQIDFLEQFSLWQVNNIPCVFLALISFHFSEYWLKKSPEARVQRVFSSYIRLHTIRGGWWIENKWYLISSGPSDSHCSQTGSEVRHFSIYGLGILETSQFVILIKNRGAKYPARRLPVTPKRYKWNLPRKKKTAARVPETRLLPEISLGRKCPQATCGVEKNPLRPASKLSSKWWLESSRKVIKWRRELWEICSWQFCLFYNSWQPWGKKSCSELNNTTSLPSNRGKFSSCSKARENIHLIRVKIFKFDN